MVNLLDSDRQPNVQLPLVFEGEGDFKPGRVVNLTGLKYWDPRMMGEIRQWVHRIPAQELILYPDISPTEPGLIPTGCVAVFEQSENFEWLRYFKGADVGCGMNFGKLPIKSADFTQQGQGYLNEIAAQIVLQGEHLGLGGGNHFLDFIDTDGQLAYLIHTGSFGDLQNPLGQLIDKPNEYLKMYQQVIASAISNRQAIAAIIHNVLGTRPSESSDTIHNSFVIENGKAIVYKGVVRVTDLQQSQIIPTSMNSPVIAVSPGHAVSAETHWGISHGSGRAVKRGDAKKLLETEEERVSGAQLGIMVPYFNGRPIELPVTELPQMYHEGGIALDRLEQTGLAGNVLGLWNVIAYAGHLPKRLS